MRLVIQKGLKMQNWLLRKCGIRKSAGQTTAEYAIIIALVAVSSIAIILIFGDQLRALFAGASKRLHSDEAVTVEDKSAGADAAGKGSMTSF
jgi:Flp pilus assembly pilin Flp